MNRRYFGLNAGFTLVELIVVIILLGILAAVALPRFMQVDGSARIAAADFTAGAFAASVTSLHAKWLLAGKPDSLTVKGTTFEFNSSGWPVSTAGGTAGCIELWGKVLDNPPPMVDYVNAGAPDAWSVLAAANLCLFMNQYGRAYSATDLLPFFIYVPNTQAFILQRYNMD